ncbi:MAG: hypothetical protein H0U13_16130 [Gemmatimonadaceae bacterium]|nr:hypothetical protein [Gemmatimonadaceae bacterium]
MLKQRGVRYGGLALSTMLSFAACDNANGPTEPVVPVVGAELVEFQPQFVSSPPTTVVTAVPQARPFPGTKVQGEASVCKDPSSHPGTYTFNVSATNRQTGDLLAPTATLTPGQCTIVYSRHPSTADRLAVTMVTITEVVPAGSRLDRVVADDDASGPRTVTGPSVTVVVNGFHGAFANYFNAAAPGGANFGLGQAPFPGTETPGQGKVCKASAPSPSGLYTFNITASGTVAGDEVAPTIAIGPGQCAIVFRRTVSNSSFATLTVTEVVPAGQTVVSIVRTQFGTTTTITGQNFATLSENVFHGGILTFNNALVTTPPPSPNFGLGQTTATETPGQGKVCKGAAPSPAGLYTFNITASGTVAGDEVAPTISIGPGQCAIVFRRTVSNSSFATLTVTEVVPAGQTVVSIVRTQFGQTTTITGQNFATLSENVFHGGILTFNNAVTTVPGPHP